MASADEYAAWIVKNADKKGTPDFDTVAQAYQAAKAAGPAHQAIANKIDNDAISQGARNFAQDANPVMNYIAGRGKAGSDLVHGIGQRLGLVDQATIDETKRLDAPLMATKAGMLGNIEGNITNSLPLVYAGASIPAAILTAAGLGFVQPTATGDSRKVLGVDVGSPVLANTITAGGLGGASVVTGRALGAAYQGGKALIEPFTDAGRQRIAGRMIQRFAENPNALAGVTNTPTLTGALPTLAEQTGDAGLARLQDSLRSVDPQINNQIAARLSDNNASRIAALRSLAGEDGARDFAVANRQGTAQDLYGQAFANDVPVTPSQLKAQRDLLQSGRIDKLLESPAIQEAQKQAQTNAANAGRPMTDSTGSIEGLHNMKLALDDMIKDPATAAQAAKVAGLKSARDKLVDVLETLSPEYKGARETYAAMSKPVNQMDIAANLLQRGASNMSDLSGNPTLNRNALLGALRDEPALIQRATGRKGIGNQLADVMTPEQLNMIRAVAAESDRAGAVATAGNGPGSATAQRMASQNILRQIVGPTGLPASWADSALANTVVGKPFNLIYGGVAEPRIQQELAQAVLDPSRARAAIAAANPPPSQLTNNALVRLLGQARRSAGPAIQRDEAQRFAAGGAVVAPDSGPVRAYGDAKKEQRYQEWKRGRA